MFFVVHPKKLFALCHALCFFLLCVFSFSLIFCVYFLPLSLLSFFFFNSLFVLNISFCCLFFLFFLSYSYLSHSDTPHATRSTARRVSRACQSHVGCSRFSNNSLFSCHRAWLVPSAPSRSFPVFLRTALRTLTRRSRLVAGVDLRGVCGSWTLEERRMFCLRWLGCMVMFIHLCFLIFPFLSPSSITPCLLQRCERCFCRLWHSSLWSGSSSGP